MRDDDYEDDDDDNPYAAPRSKVHGRKRRRGRRRPPEPEGSYGAGIALGAILGLWGLIGAAILAKSETKKGALHGFLGRIGVTVVLVAIMVALEG